MRKIIWIVSLTALFMVGCQSNSSNEAIIEENESYKSELEALKSIGSEMEQDYAELKSDLENLQAAYDHLENVNAELQEALSDASQSSEVEQFVASVHKGNIRFVELPRQEEAYQSATIIGYNTEFYDEALELVDVSGNQDGTMAFHVFGSLYNFKVISMKPTDEEPYYAEDELIHDLGEVRNQTLVFHSVLSEGMPSEKITWENASGETFEYLLGYDGYGFANEVIVSELLEPANRTASKHEE